MVFRLCEQPNIHVYHDVDTAVYIYCTQGNITYELIGDFIAQQFFQINPYNGDVSVRRHLTTDRSQSESYQVTVTNYLPIDNYFLNDNIDNAGKIIIIIKSRLTDLLNFYLKYNYLFTQCAVFLFISHQ